MAKNKKKTGPEKRFFISLSIKEATGWLTLVLFICGWFFVLGVVVGRWHAPAPAKDEALPEKLVAAREKALADPGRTAAPDPGETPELLPAGRDDSTADDSTASRPRPGKKEEPPPTDETLETEIETKTPRAGKTEAAAEPEVAAAAEEAAFTIQIAALKDEKKANRLLANLEKNNFPAYVRQARLPDGSVWFRVRCGAFPDRSAADSMMTALRKKEYSPLLVKQ